MAETGQTGEGAEASGPVKKKTKGPLLVGVVLMIALGGGGFFATSQGLLDGLLGAVAPESKTVAGRSVEGDGAADDTSASPEQPVEVARFVPLNPLVISLGSGRELTHLRFSGHLEVERGSEDIVMALMPRVVDVLNSYLRAIEPDSLAEPSQLIRYRAQMLRRIQLVVGDGRVKDLLIAEFVLN